MTSLTQQTIRAIATGFAGLAGAAIIVGLLVAAGGVGGAGRDQQSDDDGGARESREPGGDGTNGLLGEGGHWSAPLCSRSSGRGIEKAIRSIVRFKHMNGITQSND